MTDICPKCGLPTDICVCEDIAREQQNIMIYTVRRRYGKMVTVVEGIDANDINIEELAKKLKTKCASGGTVKDGNIELQGDHKKTVYNTLMEMGFNAEMV